MGLQQTMKALADPIRREILDLLKEENIPVYGFEINSALYMFLLENTAPSK